MIVIRGMILPCISLAWLVTAAPTLAVTIQGVVRNPAGKALPQTVVEVSMAVDGYLRVVKRTTTDREGRYKISVPTGTIVSGVTFDHDSWQPRVVKNLSGVPGDDHVINKVLLDRSGPKSFQLILGQIHEYVDLFDLANAARAPESSLADLQRELRQRYRTRILAMPDPRRATYQGDIQKKVVANLSDGERAELSKRLDSLFQLYGIQVAAEWTRIDQPDDLYFAVIDAVATSEGLLRVAGVTVDGSLWWAQQNDRGWSRWQSAGLGRGVTISTSPLRKTLAMERDAGGGIQIVAVSMGELWGRGVSRGFGRWEALGRHAAKRDIEHFELAHNHDGHLEIVALDNAGQMVTRKQEKDKAWGEWHTDYWTDGGMRTRTFAIGKNEDGRLEAIMNQGGRMILSRFQHTVNGGFRLGFGDPRIRMERGFGPLAVARNREGTLEFAAIKAGKLVRYQQPEPNGTAVGNRPRNAPRARGWRSLWGSPTTGTDPLVAVFLDADKHGYLTEHVIDGSGGIWHRHQTGDDATWSRWLRLGTAALPKRGYPSVAVCQDKDGETAMFVIRDGAVWQRGPLLDVSSIRSTAGARIQLQEATKVAVQYCARCHRDPEPSAPKLIMGDDFANDVDWARIVEVIDEGTMPPVGAKAPPPKSMKILREFAITR